MITPSCYIDWRSTKGLKALAEEPFLPLAMAEASKFYRKQERGRFKFDDLLSVATEALLRVSIEARELEASKGKGVNYARKAIRGALLDHLRDYYKLVRNIEMTEAEYFRTQGDLAPERASAAVRRCYVYREAGESRFVRYTIYTPGPYRSNHQLLTGGGKVSSKHGMVSVPIGRASYKDGWNSDHWRTSPCEGRVRQATGGRSEAPQAGTGEHGVTSQLGRQGTVRRPTSSSA